MLPRRLALFVKYLPWDFHVLWFHSSKFLLFRSGFFSFVSSLIKQSPPAGISSHPVSLPCEVSVSFSLLSCVCVVLRGEDKEYPPPVSLLPFQPGTPPPCLSAQSEGKHQLPAFLVQSPYFSSQTRNYCNKKKNCGSRKTQQNRHTQSVQRSNKTSAQAVHVFPIRMLPVLTCTCVICICPHCFVQQVKIAADNVVCQAAALSPSNLYFLRGRGTTQPTDTGCTPASADVCKLMPPWGLFSPPMTYCLRQYMLGFI